MVITRGQPGRLVGLIVVGSLALVGLIVGMPALLGRLAPPPSVVRVAQDPRSVSLSEADLPAGLSLCPASAAIGDYLQRLEAAGSPSYEVSAQQWSRFRASGASAGWVQSYAQQPEDCAGRLGERKGPAAISFAFRFGSAPEAVGAFRSGFLGLRPEPGLVLPGLVEGAATQLSPQAWKYDQTTGSPGVFAAFWSRHEFDLFLFTERLPAAAGERAALGMNSRIR